MRMCGWPSSTRTFTTPASPDYPAGGVEGKGVATLAVQRQPTENMPPGMTIEIIFTALTRGY